MKTTDVFYVSYGKDAEWLSWSLKTVLKNLSGFRRIHIVCPEQDRMLFPCDPFKIILHPIPDWSGLGYYWQQWVKMTADTYSDADFICHIDSDVFVKEPVSVSDFFTGDLPSWLHAFYAECPDTPWQAPTQRATGTECPREFMQGFPFILHRETYGKARAWIEGVHGKGCAEYIRKAFQNGEPPAFSEFNFLGNVAWATQHGEYAWVDRNHQQWPAGFHRTRQFWSHAPLEDHLPEIKQMLDGGKAHHPVVTNRGWWVLSNDTHISKWVEETNRLDHDTGFVGKICEHIGPGDTVVDVGAFIGDHTIAYARAVHGVDSGRVLAFEPNPAAFECLRRNMEKLGHVQCFNVGLGDAPREMRLLVDPNAGGSHLSDGCGGVAVRTLDSFEIDRLHLMKIDAEGMELLILQGAERTINRCKPVIVMEVNAGALARFGVNEDMLFGWMRDHGYRIDGAVPGAPQYDVFCFPQ
jgi:FkbM family methyltransferase